jgi:hypothetical protein
MLWAFAIGSTALSIAIVILVGRVVQQRSSTAVDRSRKWFPFFLPGSVIINGKAIKRVKVGQEKVMAISDEGVCVSCERNIGMFHERGCDQEECPSCHQRLIYCDCHIDDL